MRRSWVHGPSSEDKASPSRKKSVTFGTNAPTWGRLLGRLLRTVFLADWGRPNMQEQLNRIEQYLAAQQAPAPAPSAPDVHAPAHKGKAK